MKGDFSRYPFKPEKHYSSVLMQQGRVQLDADWNEQQAIQQYRLESETVDLVGRTGTPKERPGFQITPQGNNLLIGKGRYYVFGIACEAEEDALFTADQNSIVKAQPYLPGATLPTDSGLYLAYLEVWQRHITAIEDPSIREVALGGADTTTRTQTIWQVRLLRVTPPTGSMDCNSAFPEWAPFELRNRQFMPDSAGGKLNARTQITSIGTQADPLCVLPATAGYRRLENQLYRVEIHKGGTRSTARFKWSRDNGTVVSEIKPTNNQVINGNEVVVYEIGKDGVLSFASDPPPEWVELSDDRLELTQQHGQLVKIDRVIRAENKIVLQPATLPSLDLQAHPTVRRWDQGGTEATTDGMAMTGDWQVLEDGIEMQFSEGEYHVGDYWLIPARTAITAETGTIDWPVDAARNRIPQLPQGTPHYFVRLALLQRDATSFRLVPQADCRKPFPALTAITAEDVSFNNSVCQLNNARTVQQALDLLCRRNGTDCSLLLGPGDDLTAALATLANQPDAKICLRVGTYQLRSPLRIENKGHITLNGSGAGTRILVSSEAGLLFVNCQSVTIRDCAIETDLAGKIQGMPDLNGALTLLNCPTVQIEAVSLRCAGAANPDFSCITIRNSTPNAVGSARIRHCNLTVGHRQIGMLLVNVARSYIEDNMIRVGSQPPIANLLTHVDYRAALRRQIISNIQLVANPPASTNATVRFNGQVVHFRSDPALVRVNRNDNDWQTAINSINPAGINTPIKLKNFLESFASQVFATGGNLTGVSPALRTIVNTLTQQDIPAAGQGVVIAGSQADEVHILNNKIQGMVQGIHVGLSQPGAARNPISAGVIQISGNTIQVNLPTSATRDRHGIFVGNCTSVVIENNYLTTQRVNRTRDLRVEAIRLFGYVDRRAIIRHNHIAGFNVGISFAPLTTPLFKQPLWIVTENVAVQAAQSVIIPPKAGSGTPGVPDANAVRSRVRGISDNFV